MNSSDAEIDRRLRDAILAEPVDTAELDRRVRRQIAGRSRWWLAIAAMLVVAFVGYRMFAPDECTDAATDHRREVVNREPRKWREDPAEIQQLANRQGVAVAIPAGYRVVRGKLCKLDGRVFLHLVVSDGARELSLYLRPRGRDERAREVYVGRARVAGFSTDRVTGLVVGDADLQFARSVWRML
jgi:hypothetical protein